MINMNDLYNDVPPTKIRQKDEPFRPARTSKFWNWVATKSFGALIERRFCAFRYKGIENYLNRNNKYPTIFFAPHSNWWDGMIGHVICNRICHKEIRIMIEELNRFPILRRAGGFSVNKKSAQSSMQSLQYAVRTLKDPNSILYLFPQGIINPPDHRPIKFQTGLAYIAQKAVKEYGQVNLIPIAVNYFFLRDNRPEILIEFGENIEYKDVNQDRKELSAYLAKNLEELCDKQIYEVSQAMFDGYETLYQQKLAWYREWEQHLKRIKIKRKKAE